MSQPKYTPPSHLAANQHLKAAAESKWFVIASETPCHHQSRTGIAVDLVVLIDTSASMRDEALVLGTTVKRLVETINPPCDYDLRTHWFGIEGTWPDTPFEQTYRSHLRQLGISNDDIRGRRLGTVINEGAQEDGARAIIDLATHFNWRSGALRLLLYLGDEALEGGNPRTQEDIQAANEAIATATEQRLKVFTYTGTGRDKVAPDPSTVLAFQRLAETTGGQAYIAPLENIDRFQTDLETVICTYDEPDETIPAPEVRPCFELRWGDGPKDQVETDDREGFCLIASNPYSNVTLKDVTIMQITATDTDGQPVPLLPDGDPSVLIKPTHMIYFGDLPPYDPNTPPASGEVSREVVLISRGAKPGPYLLHLVYRHWIEFPHLNGTDSFKLSLLRS